MLFTKTKFITTQTFLADIQQGILSAKPTRQYQRVLNVQLLKNAGGYKLASSLSVTERLINRFNLLPEKATGSNCSIDEELCVSIPMHPDLELALNINPDNVVDPERVYRKVVSELSIAFFESIEIKKIISVYVGGSLWEKWNEGEREFFISENVKQLEETDERAADVDEMDKALDLVTRRRSGDFEREQEERRQVKAIINSISKVEILTGIVDNDPGSWRIYIDDAVFEIPSGKMKTHKEFETMFLSNFGDFLPASLTVVPKGVIETPWRVFVKMLYNRAVKIAPEDSTAMIEIGIILDILSGYQKKSDTIEWNNNRNGKMLLDTGDYYLISGSNMAKISQDKNFKTDAGTIGKIMTRRGMKRPGNPAKRVKGRKIPVKSWWIKKEVLDGEENADIGDDE
jgi:hypothetical protein